MDPPPSTSGRGSRLLSKSPPALRVLIADENQQRIAERGLLAPRRGVCGDLAPRRGVCGDSKPCSQPQPDRIRRAQGGYGQLSLVKGEVRRAKLTAAGLVEVGGASSEGDGRDTVRVLDGCDSAVRRRVTPRCHPVPWRTARATISAAVLSSCDIRRVARAWARRSCAGVCR